MNILKFTLARPKTSLKTIKSKIKNSFFPTECYKTEVDDFSNKNFNFYDRTSSPLQITKIHSNNNFIYKTEKSIDEQKTKIPRIKTTTNRNVVNCKSLLKQENFDRKLEKKNTYNTEPPNNKPLSKRILLDEKNKLFIDDSNKSINRISTTKVTFDNIDNFCFNETNESSPLNNDIRNLIINKNLNSEYQNNKIENSLDSYKNKSPKCIDFPSVPINYINIIPDLKCCFTQTDINIFDEKIIKDNSNTDIGMECPNTPIPDEIYKKFGNSDDLKFNSKINSPLSSKTIKNHINEEMKLQKKNIIKKKDIYSNNIMKGLYINSINSPLNNKRNTFDYKKFNNNQKNTVLRPKSINKVKKEAKQLFIGVDDIEILDIKNCPQTSTNNDNNNMGYRKFFISRNSFSKNIDRYKNIKMKNKWLFKTSSKLNDYIVDNLTNNPKNKKNKIEFEIINANKITSNYRKIIIPNEKEKLMNKEFFNLKNDKEKNGVVYDSGMFNMPLILTVEK